MFLGPDGKWFAGEDLRDTVGSVTVPEAVGGNGPELVGEGLTETVENSLTGATCDNRQACVHGFGAIGGVPSDDAGDA